MGNTSSGFQREPIAMRRWIASFGRFRRLVADRRGVAAIEFALIAPLMLAMCLVTWELALAIETSRKVGRAGSLSGDLVAQLQSVTASELQGILDIGSSIIQPYNRTDPDITITAIEITDEPASQTLVRWEYKLEGKAADGTNEYAAGDPPGTVTSVPEDLRIPGSFLIKVYSHLDYRPIIVWSDKSKETLGLTSARATYDMDETYYLRPRITNAISCSGCYD